MTQRVENSWDNIDGVLIFTWTCPGTARTCGKYNQDDFGEMDHLPSVMPETTLPCTACHTRILLPPVPMEVLSYA